MSDFSLLIVSNKLSSFASIICLLWRRQEKLGSFQIFFSSGKKKTNKQTKTNEKQVQKNYLLEISPRGSKHGVKLLLQSKNHIYNQHINGKMHEVLIHFKSIVPTKLKTMPWIDE